MSGSRALLAAHIPQLGGDRINGTPSSHWVATIRIVCNAHLHSSYEVSNVVLIHYQYTLILLYAWKSCIWRGETGFSIVYPMV